MAVSRDVAYAGTDDQYWRAWTYLDGLVTRLKQCLTPVRGTGDVLVSMIAIPGNHDYLFQEEQGARDQLITSILSDRDHAVDAARDASIVDVCTAVQQPFFQFLGAITLSDAVSAATGYDRRLSYRYRVEVRWEAVTFVCLNTAWLSQGHES